MLFELSNDYIKKGTVREPSKLVLPSGLHLVLMNPTGTPVKKNAKCHFTHIRTNCLFIMSGLGVHVSGDILITMIEMGYDIASKGEWKRAKKDDKDKILNEYDKLKSKKPDLFDASKIDLLNFDGEIVNQQLEKEDVDQVQNPKPSDAIDTQMESPILNQVKNKFKNMSESIEVSMKQTSHCVFPDYHKYLTFLKKVFRHEFRRN